MLTGRRAFEAEDVSETLAAVLMREPDWSWLPATTPAVVITVLRRCLQKNPKQRMRDIGDVSLALDGAFETSAVAAPQGVAPVAPLWRRAMPSVTSAAAMAVLLLGAVWAVWPAAMSPVIRSESRPVRVGAGARAHRGDRKDLMPDGQSLLIAAFADESLSPEEGRRFVTVYNWFEELKRLVPVD